MKSTQEYYNVLQSDNNRTVIYIEKCTTKDLNIRTEEYKNPIANLIFGTLQNSLAMTTHISSLLQIPIYLLPLLFQVMNIFHGNLYSVEYHHCSCN